jgi:flagellar hook-length control protein FliK
MTNLPITASAPQTAAKPTQAAPAEEASTQGKPFGDVLARQVSETAPADEPAPALKKVTAKTAAKSAEELLKAEDTKAPTDTTANLPGDMLAALLPQGAATVQATTSVSAAESSEQLGQDEAAAELSGLLGQTGSAARPGLPGSSSANNAAEQRGTAKAAPAAVGTKAGAGTESLIPAAAKGAENSGREALADSKKDAVFASMMATMSATQTNKNSAADEKAIALAAAPQPNAAALAAMQANNTTLAPAIVAPTLVTINTPVTNEKWGDEFNQKITWLSTQKEQSAELHLNPPQLGPMDVVLKVSGDQATAMFSSPHAAVREAIEQALPKLREMMADSGIMLGNATVNDQAPRNRQNDSEGRSGNSRQGINGISDSATTGNASMRVSPISRHNGIVDTFA